MTGQACHTYANLKISVKINKYYLAMQDSNEKKYYVLKLRQFWNSNFYVRFNDQKQWMNDFQSY